MTKRKTYKSEIKNRQWKKRDKAMAKRKTYKREK